MSMNRHPASFVNGPSPSMRPSSSSSSVLQLARAALAMGLLALGGVSLTASCGSPDPVKPPPLECVGGVINPETKVCEGKCTPDKCVENNTCVGNRCVLKCTSHLDCLHDGSQNCAPAVEDDTNAAIFTCQPSGRATGVGLPCPLKTECAGYSACPNGAPCSPDACAVSDCQPLVCITKGEGDATAYCSVPGCSVDEDCAAGYYCGLTRDPHEICGSNPMKGDNNLCGKTAEPCLDPATFGQGNTLSEGSACILRKTCLKRAQCAACKDDLDCSLIGSQKCVDVGGETRCLRDCKLDKDCDPDSECVIPAGDLTGSCKPRFGKCVGTGGFCEPCQNDEDCGGKGTTKVCYNYNGGQTACLDLSSNACATDADCPKSLGPTPLNGLCSNGTCLPPNVNDELTCWP